MQVRQILGVLPVTVPVLGCVLKVPVLGCCAEEGDIRAANISSVAVASVRLNLVIAI